MKLPQIREFGWKLKPLETAHTEVNTLPTGQTELIIKHDVIRGITVEMLWWWFECFANLKVTIQGNEYPAYHLWHPYDHIAVHADSHDQALRQGDHLMINECFQRNRDYYMKENAFVYYLQKDGIGLRGTKFGKTLMQLNHGFKQVSDGVQYDSRMVLGVDTGMLRLIANNVIIPRLFGQQKAKAWLRHNVEEVGCFENFLAQLYEKRGQGAHIILD